MRYRAATSPLPTIAAAASSLLLLCCLSQNGIDAFALSCAPRHSSTSSSAGSFSREQRGRAQSTREHAAREARSGLGCTGWNGAVRGGRASSRGGRLRFVASFALRSNDGGYGEEEGEGDDAFDSIFDKNSALLDVPLELFDENRVESLMPGSTRTELPVFMLDLAACPGGVVPLHIFEMRYRQLFNDIGTKDNRFGLLVSDPATGKPCKFGSVMECAQRKLLPDGRQYVLNQSVERFRVLKMLKTVPYTTMEVEVGIPDDTPVEGEASKWGAEEGTRIDELEQQVYSVVHSVVELMNKLSPPADPSENRTLSEWFLRYSPKAKIEDEGIVGEVARDDDLQGQADENKRREKFSFAVAEMISMAPHTKQLLLQSRSTAYRLMAEREILVKAQKELAARSSLKDTLG